MKSVCMKPKLLNYLLFTICFSLLLLLAQKLYAASDLDTSSSSGNSKPLFMWKAQRDKDIIYIVGSINAPKIGFFPLPKEIENAFVQSQELFIPYLKDAATSEKDKQFIKAKSKYTGQDKLSDHLNPETKKSLDEYFQWSGETLEMYEPYTPAATMMLICSGATDKYRANNEDLTVYFANKAKASAKKITELTSSMSDVRWLMNASETEQNAVLRHGLMEIKDYESDLKETVLAWQDGNPERMEKTNKRHTHDDPEINAVYDKRVDAQNVEIVKKLDQILKSKSGDTYFLAIATPYLVGDKGLLTLLRNAGFSVEQMQTSDEAPKPTTSFGARKLERLSYPEAQCSILLPGPPEMKSMVESNGTRHVDATYRTFAGNYEFQYIIFPGVINPNATKALYDRIELVVTNALKTINPNNKNKAIKERKVKEAKIVSRYSINFQGFIGRELTINVIDTNNKIISVSKVRLICAGKYLYMLIAEGEKAWVNSPIVTEFLNSLRIRTASSPNTSSSRSNSTTPSLRNATDRQHSYMNAIRQSDIRKDMERARNRIRDPVHY